MVEGCRIKAKDLEDLEKAECLQDNKQITFGNCSVSAKSVLEKGVDGKNFIHRTLMAVSTGGH